MKLRQLADDFAVEEQNSLPVGIDGKYGVYVLRKSHWTTLDALARVARHFRLARQAVAHAGLKDRHACTSQIITIANGPPESYAESDFSLEYVGQARRATNASDIAANAFRIVIRSLSPEEVQFARNALRCLQATGLPNYFDDQRFGSYFPGEGFIAEAWIREDYKRALWLTFAEHQVEDSSAEKRQKAILREHWGDFTRCKQELDRSHRRSIATFLADRPGDFKGAWARVNGDLRGLYLSALQSDLWNRITSEYLARQCDPDQLQAVSLKTGPVMFPVSIDREQRDALLTRSIPLPSSRIKKLPNDIEEVVTSVLANAGWSLRQLKVKSPRDRFFSRQSRPVLIGLDSIASEFAEDELQPGRVKLTIAFTLPRGAYATMLVKRLFTPCEPNQENEAALIQ